MTFAAPLILLALLVLPLLWWLLRATPPAPRAQIFPAIRLLANLRAREETPARTPWWLLALRLAAAALIIVGLAGPLLGGRGGVGLTGAGPLLLVLDNGWGAAADWAERLTAAQAALDRAEHDGRNAILLTTAASPLGEKPRATPAIPPAELRPLLGALQPSPWGTDRAQAASILATLPSGPAVYVADGIAGADDGVFAAALAAHGRVTELHSLLPPRLLSARTTPDGLTAHLRQLAAPQPRREQVLAETGDGRVLSRATLDLPAGATEADVPIALPPELRNQLSALRLAATPGAGSVALLDESARRRPVGLLGSGGGDIPLLGTFFYVDRALAPTAEIRRGELAGLLARPLSLLIVANRKLEGDELTQIGGWVSHGGLLLRFAGPDLTGPRAAETPAAETPAAETSAAETQAAEIRATVDELLPVKLLAGDRQLGGAMSWSQPEKLAPFPAGSPFAGLPIPAEVTIGRQMLAEPTSELAAQTWASLTDGTPLVTAARHGAGEIVLFHVTANADWSNLPLSGLFVDMLDRLVKRAAGIQAADDTRALPPAQSLDGTGVLGPPPPTARPIAAGAFAHAAVSPVHPAGFYGLDRDRHALNLGDATPTLAAAAPIPGARVLSLDAAPRTRPAGPSLLALALALLCIDMLLTLRLRGLLRAATALLLLGCLAQTARAAENPALTTHLAYIVTGDAQVDGIARAGLAGLSDYVNDRTAAVLGTPAAVTPGRDDLSYYPLLYWPITADAAPPAAFTAALNDYMHRGGIVIIDTRGGGSGAGFAPGTDAGLRRASAGLDVPRLAPLTNQHVLARAFYLLSDFPGRFDGSAVWVQQDQDRSNDSVSPVIIGANDWAAAWATDEDGKPLYAAIPGGDRQHVLALRFGVNLVMYALTGNYKGDQVHVPAILQRLGQ